MCALRVLGGAENHKDTVREHFRTTRSFLEINLSDKGLYLKMCGFLGKEAAVDDFPWLNKS